MISKLRFMFLFIVLVPQAVIFGMTFGSPLAVNSHFSQIQALSLASSLLLALGLPGLAVDWLIGPHFTRMRELCSRVKQGNYRELLKLPNESRDGVGEDGITLLMRDMNWMARQIEMRERDLQQAVVQLSESQKHIDEQNKYLKEMNCKLLDAQDQMKQQSAELERTCKRMQVMAMTDPLTRMANRRCFFDTLSHHFVSSICNLRPISLLILDIDKFKGINDNYGHQAGDTVLKEVAEVIQQNIRNSDLAARIGGEEYAILVTDAYPEAAAVVAKKIKAAVENHIFILEDSLQIRITVSIGICTLTQLPCRIDVEKLYSFADQALYYSKNSGRNCISVYYTDTSAIAKLA